LVQVFPASLDLYKPLPIEHQVVIIFAGVRGHLDNVPVKQIRTFEKEWLSTVISTLPNVITNIVTTKVLSKDDEKALNELCLTFKKRFQK
jgi:F-type H+-transporting ATPase subunit alpha